MNIGIDIGGSHIGIGLVNHKGQIIKKVEQDIEKREEVDKYIIENIDSSIKIFSQEAKIEKIGIVAPGNPKKDSLVIENLVNLGLENLDFSKLAKKYKVPVQLKNDAKAAGLAEFKYGAIKDCNDAVFLCLGTGVGSAVFLNGKLLQANRNTGFEIGHMIIEKDGQMCNCGKRGCFETYCSMKRFRENVKDILNVKDAKAIELLDIIRENENNFKLKKLINEYINNLIIGLSNLIDIFEPEAICLGGSFVFFKDIFYQKLINEMEERRYVFNKDKLPRIVLADLKNDAGILGAAI